jgi:hypothetical protein
MIVGLSLIALGIANAIIHSAVMAKSKFFIKTFLTPKRSVYFTFEMITSLLSLLYVYNHSGWQYLNLFYLSNVGFHVYSHIYIYFYNYKIIKGSTLMDNIFTIATPTFEYFNLQSLTGRGKLGEYLGVKRFVPRQHILLYMLGASQDTFTHLMHAFVITNILYANL